MNQQSDKSVNTVKQLGGGSVGANAVAAERMDNWVARV